MTKTRRVLAAIEAAGFQFLKVDGGWSLFDTDDRTEVVGIKRTTLGGAIWAAADMLKILDTEHQL